MGELILCKEPLAGIPYFFEDLSLNVYSLEEVSFYIQKQAFLLDGHFANHDLCHWIRKEIGLRELADTLEKDIEEHEPLHVFVRHLLSACGYLTKQEIIETVEIVAGYENKSEAEVKKMRADRLMENGRIVDAIYAYEGLLNQKIKKSQALLGNVYHNLGCAYAKLFFNSKAADCFELAYRQNRNASSLINALYMHLLNEDEESLAVIINRYQVLPEQVEAARNELHRLFDSGKYKEFKEALSHMRSDYPGHEDYRKHLYKLVKRWEEEYHMLCKF